MTLRGRPARGDSSRRVEARRKEKGRKEDDLGLPVAERGEI